MVPGWGALSSGDWLPGRSGQRDGAVVAGLGARELLERWGLGLLDLTEAFVRCSRQSAFFLEFV